MAVGNNLHTTGILYLKNKTKHQKKKHQTKNHQKKIYSQPEDFRPLSEVRW